MPSAQQHIETENADAAAVPRSRVPLDENVARARAIADAQRLANEATPAPARMAAGDRQPFGAQEQQLAHPPIPGFRLYWFNDTPGRIGRAKRAGYEHVLDVDTGEPLNRVVDRTERGAAQKGYLMKIPVQWYYEDMAAAQETRDRNMQSIKEGRHGANVGQNQYVPKQGIVIDERR